nr:methyltransferase domain-containing protein [Anaerobacillus arseniciselenatis]
MNSKKMIDIKQGIQAKYAKISQTAIGKFNYKTGKEGALSLGYDKSILDCLPDEALNSFCGVGNPFSLGEINAGETVLDIGCGAGVDLLVASTMVGDDGLVCGIDITPEMVDKANTNFKNSASSNGEVIVASSEKIPYNDETFGVITSNGVLNLSPLKQQSFEEIYRVLKPGGTLQFADIVLQESIPLEMTKNVEAWSN